MKRMTKKTLAVALTAAMCLTLAGCGGSDKKETKAAETKAGETTAVAEEGAVDLNALTLDEIIEKAKAEGKVESVGMPDSWANWGLTWQDLKDEYAIDHADTDMSSSEELQMFKTEGENGTKDIGDVGFAFGQQAIDEDLVQGYKTSYWDSVPAWAKAEDGKWMVAYTGATTFLTNTEQVENVPTSWADIKAGDYKVALGDIGGGTAQAAVIASAYAFGGDLNNLDPAFEFWTELAEAGRINTLDILQQNFETGEIAVGVIWSYTAVPYKDQITQYKMEATIPSDGSIMSGYASVINKYAPHPHAAALAREWIFSDAGQANLAKAGAIPTRTDVEIPAEIEEATFAKADYANAIPMEDAEAYAAACETVKTRWEEEILPLLVQ